MPGFIVVADRRVFAVMSFLNIAGFDKEVPGKAMHPVRAKVRDMLTANLREHLEKVAAWRKLYADSHLQSFHYLDFALSLTPDYPFRRAYEDRELGYPATAGRLRGFPDILNDFWATASVEKVWDAVKPDYLAELRKYDLQRMAADLALTWKYLRQPRSDSFVLVNVPNLLDSYYHAIGAQYDPYYYSVESPGAGSYSLNVHEYLHHFVNPLVEANFGRQRSKLHGYYDAGRRGPMARSYQNDVTFVYECLVRALDSRIEAQMTDDTTVKANVEKRVARETREGLTLVNPFFLLLAQFEESGQRFDRFLPVLLDKLPALPAK